MAKVFTEDRPFSNAQNKNNEDNEVLHSGVVCVETGYAKSEGMHTPAPSQTGHCSMFYSTVLEQGQCSSHPVALGNEMPP